MTTDIVDDLRAITTRGGLQALADVLVPDSMEGIYRCEACCRPLSDESELSALRHAGCQEV
jgi:hypothetical protein